MVTGTVNIATSDYITQQEGRKPSSDVISFQLTGVGLSQTVTINLQASVDGVTFANVQEAGEDIALSLPSSTTIIESFKVDTNLYYRLYVATSATGSINYSVSL